MNLPVIQESRCTGHCCRSFPINNLSPEEIMMDFERWLAGHKSRYPEGEIEKVAKMIIPLGQRDDGRHFYTCKHHDTVTGNCKNYENRPKLCSEFPSYGGEGACHIAECTYKEKVMVDDRTRQEKPVK